MGDLNLNPFLILNLEVRLPAAKFLTTTSSGIIFAFYHLFSIANFFNEMSFYFIFI